MHSPIIHSGVGDTVYNTMATLLDSDASLTDESLEEMEMNLTDIEESCASSLHLDDCGSAGQEYVGLFFETIKKLKEEEHVKVSYREGTPSNITYCIS